MGLQELIHRLPGLLLNNHLQQNKVHATVSVFAAFSQFRLFDFLHDDILERIVHIEMFRDFGREPRLLRFRHQVREELEIVTGVSVCIYTYGVGDTLGTTV